MKKLPVATGLSMSNHSPLHKYDSATCVHGFLFLYLSWSKFYNFMLIGISPVLISVDITWI